VGATALGAVVDRTPLIPVSIPTATSGAAEAFEFGDHDAHDAAQLFALQRASWRCAANRSAATCSRER